VRALSEMICISGLTIARYRGFTVIMPVTSRCCLLVSLLLTFGCIRGRSPRTSYDSTIGESSRVSSARVKVKGKEREGKRRESVRALSRQVPQSSVKYVKRERKFGAPQLSAIYFEMNDIFFTCEMPLYFLIFSALLFRVFISSFPSAFARASFRITAAYFRGTFLPFSYLIAESCRLARYFISVHPWGDITS